jgi:hypothetical protein
MKRSLPPLRTLAPGDAGVATRVSARSVVGLWMLGCLAAVTVQATPANRAALERHYDRFLPRKLAQCSVCHLPSQKPQPESLEEIPHNPFGDRLRRLGEADRPAGSPRPSLEARLTRIATEDADGDGVDNETELLLGQAPGDAASQPKPGDLAAAPDRKEEFRKFLAGYRWKPFEPVQRPAVPQPVVAGMVLRNPVDAFLAEAWLEQGLKPRPEAPREVLLRRVYQDLIGLNPSPEEQQAFAADTAPDAYERVVDRLLRDPRHGERWARHWMDVWRYSDWAGWADGNQIRDSQPHIWRWRDWIVESIESDRPYDRMLTEMLAADEVAPGDPAALRATGFLARNFKLLSREQWLEDTVKHTSQAFMGLTVGCAKCHDHMTDPVSQKEYYAFRAIFEPHQVRIDRVPGQLDTGKDGVPRVYDAAVTPTWFLVRGDERHPLTNDVIRPGIPGILGGALEVSEVRRTQETREPDRRPFVIQDLLAASAGTIESARKARETLLGGTNTTPAQATEADLAWEVARQQDAALNALLAAESAAFEARPEAAAAATNAVLVQRTVAVTEARLAQAKAARALAEAPTNRVAEARQKLTAAEGPLAEAIAALAKPLDATFKPRTLSSYPETSTGRRSALARWLVRPQHPLTARVAANHVWLRHFGSGLVPTPADFGRNGRPPTHPALLDWLASELSQPQLPEGSAPARPWSLRHLHRLLVTSSAYRMASTPEAEALAKDPDNRFLWRMTARRLEAEAVRDNVLWASGGLDLSRGGPDIDQREAMKSRRRSLYLRHAAEKQAEFLQIFDGPAVTECYVRRPSVMPQQALALGNSELVTRESVRLAATLAQESGGDEGRFVQRAFERILGRSPTGAERAECLAFLRPVPVGTAAGVGAGSRGGENLVRVLFNHHDFVVVR